MNILNLDDLEADIDDIQNRLTKLKNDIQCYREYINSINKVDKEDDPNYVYRKIKQAEGIQKAKEKGVKFGRKPFREIPANFDEICEAYKNKWISLATASERCKMPRTTFVYHYKKYVKRLEGEE